MDSLKSYYFFQKTKKSAKRNDCSVTSIILTQHWVLWKLLTFSWYIEFQFLKKYSLLLYFLEFRCASALFELLIIARKLHSHTLLDALKWIQPLNQQSIIEVQYSIAQSLKYFCLNAYISHLLREHWVMNCCTVYTAYISHAF